MKISSVVLVSVLVLAVLPGFASAATPKAPPTPSPEMRQKMADLHQKMADCLRSDKPISECHQQMMQGCQEIMGKDGCPMMGGMGTMGKHRGMHHGGMMPPTGTPTDNK